MEEELAKQIYDKNNYDITIVRKIFEMLLIYFNIGQIKLVAFNDKKKTGYYDYENNEIGINLNLIAEICKSLDSSELTFFLAIVETLFHEFLHAKHRLCQTSDNPVEDTLLYQELYYRQQLSSVNINKLGINGLLKYSRKISLIDKLYRYSPDERLARIDSSLNTIHMAKLLGDDKSVKIFLGKLLNECLFGYKNANGKTKDFPTIHFFNKIGVDIKEEIKDYEDDLDDFDRVRYGLDIDDDDITPYIGNALCLKLLNKK